MLRALRGSRSLREIASSVGLSHSVIAMAEKDTRIPHLETLGALAEAYGVIFHIDGIDSYWIERKVGGVSFSEEELRMRFPHIHWNEPMQVHVLDTHRWACRYCIAQNGLVAQQVLKGEQSYATEQEAIDHIREAHG